MWQLHMCSSSSMKSVPSSIHTRKLYLLLHYKLTPTMRRLSFPSRYLCLFACHVHLPFVHIIMLQVVSFKKYSCSSLLLLLLLLSGRLRTKTEEEGDSDDMDKNMLRLQLSIHLFAHFVKSFVRLGCMSSTWWGHERDTACQLILGVGY